MKQHCTTPQFATNTIPKALKAASIAIVIAMSLLLQSCVFVAGAAAGATAIAMVYDHRTIESVLQDAKIANSIVDKIRHYPFLRDKSHIEVAVFNRVVLLTGEIPNRAWKEKALNIASSVPGVERVYDQTTQQGPTSALARTSDAWTTTKIKGAMLATKNLRSGSIKVITEHGVVYLMGKVSHKQASIAVDIARQVSGVQKVIKIFQYTEE